MTGKLTLSESTGAAIAVGLYRDAAQTMPLDLSMSGLRVVILAGVGGVQAKQLDLGSGVEVSGVGNNVLTFTLPDDHGLVAGEYRVHAMHDPGGGWRDLFVARLTVARPGWFGEMEIDGVYQDYCAMHIGVD
jgi:hypothetical protein